MQSINNFRKNMKTTTDMVLFWRAADIYSNWHPSVFTVRGTPYANAEQFLMAEKARLFEDPSAHAKIMKATDPLDMKNLGQTVKGYSDSVWFDNREAIMLQAVSAKFGQIPELYQQLMATQDRDIVEASPYDKIWGIGLGENDPWALNKSKWRGLNLLGKSLMDARAHFLKFAWKPEAAPELF